MALIFVGSTDVLSTPHTSRFLGPALRWLFPGFTNESLQGVQAVIRKFGHLTEYAILAILLWRARRQPVANDTRPWSWCDARFAVVIAGLYAVTDEFHQSFVSTRQGSPWDVLIDTVGATIGIVVLWRLGRWRKKW
jgi:VanZ family protein